MTDSKLNGEAGAPVPEAPKITPLVNVEARQIQNVLSFVESTMEESVKRRVFERLGLEHTTNPHFRDWILGYRNNIQSFFNMVNSNQDRYWERLEYDPENSAVRVIGRIVDRCACPYAQAPNPPLSLCHHCCKSFQKQMFELLFQKPVTVQIDTAYLLGNDRCSTTIFVEGGLGLEKI
jgi:hypothetical protein